MKHKVTQTGGKLAHTWAALYSISQNCFHVEYLYEHLHLNIRHCLAKKEGEDYRMIGLFETEQEAHDMIEYVRFMLTGKSLEDNISHPYQDGHISNYLVD